MKKYGKLLALVLIILGVYFLLNFLIKERIINRYYGGILVLVCINMVLALSLNLITGFTGQLCLGHAGFMSIGAYAGAMVSIKLQLPFVVALLIGGLIAAIIALIIGIPTLKLTGDYFAITTLGVGEIIRVIITNLDSLGGPRGLPGIPSKTNFTWAYFIMIISAIIIYNIIHSSQGRAMISIRENEIAAEAMGVNTTKFKVMAFVIAAFFAGVAGALYSHYAGFIVPDSFNFIKSIEILTFVVFGGMGSLSGTFIATTLLTLLPEALRDLKDLRMIIYPLALVVLMIFRPEGLMGSKELSIKKLLSRTKSGKGESLNA
jgi:branched-chain amino acid transport system permease protein